jgi:hypothetical protein
MIPYAELESFFAGLVATAQSQGITCAITNDMACVHFGVAATTKDCDVLCDAAQSDAFRALIAGSALRDLLPNYRGNLSPPLDARWMRGGWTAHFTWKTKPDETCLDIFGNAPRGSSSWETQLAGIYARRNVVAEMKRTNREKDWPFATALGGQMLDEGNPDGWMHLYDADILRLCARQSLPPALLTGRRPILKLAPFTDEWQVKRLLMAERVFWSQLDELRVRIYQRHLRPYTSAVRKASGGNRLLPLEDSHSLRIECATTHLPFHPLRDHGLQKLVEEARANTGLLLGPDVIEWLPDASFNFHGL